MHLVRCLAADAIIIYDVLIDPAHRILFLNEHSVVQNVFKELVWTSFHRAQYLRVKCWGKTPQETAVANREIIRQLG
jgi:aromatic ring hydroxylase